MTAHDYARSLADKGTPLTAISRATGLSIQDIGYLRPRERQTYVRPEPKSEQKPMPVFTAPVVNLKSHSQQVLEQSCAEHGITVEEAKSGTRKRPVSWPRQGVMFDLFVKCPQLSTPIIGRMLGGRDHTTILHGIEKHAARIGLRYEHAFAMRAATALSAGVPVPYCKMDMTRPAFQEVMRRYALTMERAL